MYDILDNYRIQPEIAPSDVKLYLESTQKYKRIKIDRILTSKDQASTRAMDRGNAYDDYFCDAPNFLNKYHLMKHKAPGEKVGNILEDLFQYCIEHLCNKDSLHSTGIALEDLDLTYKPLGPIIEQLVLEYEHQPNWGIDTRVKSIIEKGDEFFKAMIAGKGRTPISIQQYTKVKDDIERLEIDPVMGNFIKALRNSNPIPNVDRFFQLEIIANPIKGKLDIAFINHVKKTARAIDIKTAANYSMWRYNYIKYYYPLQGSMYRELLKTKVPEGYTVLPTEFIVIYTQSEDSPRRFVMTEVEDQIWRDGGILPVIGNVEGWQNIVEEIQWQQTLPEVQQFHCRKNGFQPTLTDELYQSIILPDLFIK